MTTTADIVIVGAGVGGAATAWHLRRLCAGKVLLLEREPLLGEHSSGRNAAIVRDVHVEEPVAALLREGADFIRTGELAHFDRCGLMLLDIGDEDLRPHLRITRPADTGSPPIGNRRHAPQGRGVWAPDCGVVDAAGLLQAYLREVEVRFDTRLLGWEHQQDHLCVNTSRGRIECGLLVNAAGPWAGALGGLPLTPTNRTLFVTPEIEWVDPRWPCIWHVKQGLYFRPESGGLLLCPCDERPAEPGDYCEDPALVDELAGKLSRLQPQLCDISIRTQWVGQRVFAPDRQFVIGFDPRYQRLFHVAALGGHGVTASYAVGRLAAEQIMDGHEDAAQAFSPHRLM
jgi:D-arginine dehydrogenase